MHDDTQQLVTVQIASRNRLPMLREAVTSALRQTWEPLELLIVDDGSDLETCSWLDEIARADRRVRVLFESHRGIGATRQRGLCEARGSLVCALDSDDRLLPSAIERAVEVFREEPGTDLVYVDNLHLLPDGRSFRRSYPRFDSNERLLRAVLARPAVPYKHSGTIFVRDVALSLGGYDDSLPLKVDIDFFLRFVGAGRKVRLLQEPLVEFRVHPDSVSHRNRLSGLGAWMTLIDRYGQGMPRWRRLLTKGLRAAAESAKALYGKARWRAGG